MIRLLLALIISITAVLISRYGFSQGCSDAGFCTMGAMKPDQPFNKKIQIRLRSIEISFYRGTTPKIVTPIIYVATADFNFTLSAKTSFQIKLPFQVVEGRLANTSGVGDISLCMTRTLISGENFDLNLSIGGRVATNNSSKDIDGLPLP